MRPEASSTGRWHLSSPRMQWCAEPSQVTARMELGVPRHLADALGRVQAVVHNQDNREHDILDSDDYYQFQGGMANAIFAVQGREVPVWHLDHSNPRSPRVRSLSEEIGLVVRSRVLNPKWQAAMRRHGYKGAAEMAATVDYLFAYGATTREGG